MTALPEVTLGGLAIHDFTCAVTWNSHVDAVEIVARYECPCVDTGEPTDVITRSVVDGETWAEMTAQERGEFIRNLCIRAMAHDVDEWLRVDGEKVEEAHANLG